MSREPRAVLFDLDDTLYPQRRFALSGFAACARHLERTRALDPRRVFSVLRVAHTNGCRGRELQACVERFQLPDTTVAELLAVMRGHAPALRLPRSSRAALTLLRPEWRLAVVTNGTPEIQRRKVAALGVAPLVDTVVFASEHGTCLGKPDPAPFLEALARLGVSAERAVFVGNDEACDIVGAAGAGMRTILLRRVAETRRRAPGLCGPSRATCVVESVADVSRLVIGMMAA